MKRPLCFRLRHIHRGRKGSDRSLWLGVILCAGILAALAFSGLGISREKFCVNRQSTPRATFSTLSKQPPAENLASLPWAFEPNVGQTDTKVNFLARANGATVFLTRRGVVLSWTPKNARTDRAGKTPPDILRLKFVGAGRAVRVAGQSILRARINYFLGRDPRKWLRDVPEYSSVEYSGLYSGVDTRFYGGPGGLEYDVVASPQSSLWRIRLRVEGARTTRLNRDGDLLFLVHRRQVVMHRPAIYQIANGRRIAVAGGYRLLSRSIIGFAVGKHRSDLPVVIDPSISIAYTTFLGGNGAEKGNSVAVDSAGAVYVGGTTTLAAFPETATATQGPLGGTSNLFVAKIDPTQSGASSLVYLTFIGGSKNDRGGMVAVDKSTTPPDLAVLGWTTSGDFPVTDASTLDGPSDLTVMKLNGAGDGLVYSKYFGGSGSEATQNAGGIATDAAGIVFVTSDTNSSDLPMTSPAPNGFATAYGGGTSDGLLAEFSATSGTLLYSSYFGIDATVGSTSVALDASGNAYVAGFTSLSGNFPAKNEFQPSYGGGAFDGFVMQINPKLGAAGLVYASLLGGSQSDQAMSIAVDASTPPAAYITGVTHSPDFIPSSGVTNAPYQPALNGSSNAFVAVINQTAAGVPSLEYESYLGGTGSDAGQGIAILSPTQVYIAGTTASSDFPVLCSLQGFSGSQDAFLAEFNPTLSGAASLVYTTLLGGSVTTEANAVAADSAGDAIIFGDTMSHDYPLAGNANNGFQPTCTSCAATTALADAVLTKVAAGSGPVACVAFTPPVVNFGAVPTGSASPPINIALANDGDANLNINANGITIAGPNSADFSQTNNCLSNSPLAPRAKCGFAVTFTPAIVGTETATLEIADDAVGTPQMLTLTGTGSSGEVSLSQNSLPFGNVPEGQTASSSTILTNIGDGALNITNTNIGGSDRADFTFGALNQCSGGLTIPSGGSCSIGIVFAPKEPNPPQNLSAEATISFAVNGNNATGTAGVALSGTEAGAAAPAVSLAATALNFASVSVGSSSSQPPVLLKNTGSAALSISAIGIAGADPSDFSQTNTCPMAPAALGAGVSCTISATFQPTTTGPRTANVSIADNATPPQQTIGLSGTGTIPGVSLLPQSLTFAAQNEGPPPSAPQNVTLKNTGASPLTISSISFTGANPADFAQTNNCPLAPAATLSAGSICTISVTFQPTATGQRAAALSVADNSTPSPQTVALSGTGTSPVVQIAPASLTFGSTVVGVASANQPVQVSNSGTGALVISGVTFGGADGGDFQASGSCIGTKGASVTVPVAGNCTADIDFLPLAVGTRSATLTLSDNSATNPTVSLTGTATDFQMAPAAGGTTSATVAAGQTAAIALELNALNGFTGSVTLGCSNPPPAGTCNVSPVSAQVSGTAPVSFTVNVTTTARSLIVPVSRPDSYHPKSPALPMAAVWLLALAVLLFTRARNKKARVLRPVLALSLLLLSSCGGGGGGTAPPSGTPAGTYIVKATATSGGTARTVDLSITVQ
ncbi:MAG: choice-of-anchor D domain-containing protein [Candidatus Acidiferrales bacterium]